MKNIAENNLGALNDMTLNIVFCVPLWRVRELSTTQSNPIVK